MKSFAGPRSSLSGRSGGSELAQSSAVTPAALPPRATQLRSLFTGPARPISSGGRIFEPGQPARNLFFVARGLVKLTDVSPAGAEVIVHLYHPGDIFGERCFLGAAQQFRAMDTLLPVSSARKRHVSAKHVARGSGALLDGVLPMLGTDVATEKGLVVIRDVPRGVHAAHASLAVFIDDDAVIDPDATICQQSTAGSTPTPATTKSHSRRWPGFCQRSAGPRAVSLQMQRLSPRKSCRLRGREPHAGRSRNNRLAEAYGR